MDLDELIAIQGNLKDLSKDNYLRLKKSILKHGFAFPFHIWKSPDGLKILDGTQRQRALKAMRDEGYYIPKLPVDYIDAKDEKHAKELILANISEYGNMTQQGLYEFIEGAEIDPEVLELDYSLNQVDFDSFINEYYDNTDPDLEDEEPEEKPKVDIIACPHCNKKFDRLGLKK